MEAVANNKIPNNVELTRMGGEVSSGIINLKKLFNSGFGTYYWIKEISSSRTEIKLSR